MLDFPDNRPLAELPLATLLPEERREALAAIARKILVDCGVIIAEDVAKLGCTGVVACPNVSKGIDWGNARACAKEVRDALGGSGVIFPCFVGPDRYCLVHETIGGLQDGQLPRHQEVLEHVSRDLLPNEKRHIATVESARRKNLREARDTLMAGDKPSLDVVEESDEAESPAAPAATAVVATFAAAWTCPEHGETVWGCRFCLAAEIVKGEYQPPLLFRSVDGDSNPHTTRAAPDEVDGRIASLDQNHAIVDAELFVRVAKWRRKLARD